MPHGRCHPGTAHAPRRRVTDEFVQRLHETLARDFASARRIAVLENRGGMLVLVGHPTGPEITRAAMLLASLSIRLPLESAYVAPGIPGPRLLRYLRNTDRGSIVTVPVLHRGVPVGSVLVEAGRGLVFTDEDLQRLAAIVRRCAPVERALG